MYIDFLLVMEHPFDDTEISKFANKLKYIPQWYTDFFAKIHKRDKSSDYYRGCYATLRFLLKFKKNIDKDKIIFYSLPCVADMILEKLEQEKIFNNDDNIQLENIFLNLEKDLLSSPLSFLTTDYADNNNNITPETNEINEVHEINEINELHEIHEIHEIDNDSDNIISS